MAERILYYDCFAGISGDMHLGALIDLGVPVEHLRTELGKLGLEDWSLEVQADQRLGIGGLRAEVVIRGEADHGAHGHDHDHGHSHADSAGHSHGPARGLLRKGALQRQADSDHHHDHDHGYAHDHNHDHNHAHEHEHAHRSWAEIRALIESSGLSAGAKRRSLAIFGKIASAEAKVHQVSIDEVGFHEVGAVDSIIDIVGAAIAIEYLAPDRIMAGSIELGGGFVRCAHGRLPVPAPATALIVAGCPVKRGAVDFEATTPTGAAILAAMVDEFSDKIRFTIQKTGHGIGFKNGPIPNLLRVFWAEAAPVTRPQASAILLESNIDDMSGELAGWLYERLLGAGAADVWMTPIMMKKGRPAQTLSVLCSPADEARMVDLILRESTTLGIRRSEVGKFMTDRREDQLPTRYGPVRVKTAILDGLDIKCKPEYEDLRRIALERQLPLRQVSDEVRSDIAAGRSHGSAIQGQAAAQPRAAGGQP